MIRIHATRKLVASLVLIASIASGAAPRAWAAPAYPNRPKLVLLVVFDQFRADYLTRFRSRLMPAMQGGQIGGFQYLMTKGAYYPFSEYELLQAMTGPGHATIATGSYPYQNGVATNKWFNRDTGERVYCAEDKAVATVGAPVVDPHVGTSPKNLVGSTFGDEMKNAGLPSRVVSVSLKDRSAIFMGGYRADLALWFDPVPYQFVSSKFYLPDGKLPDWVNKLNDKVTATKGKPTTLDLQGPQTGFSMADGLKGMKFPLQVSVGQRESSAFPFGLEVTADAAIAAMDAYKLGNGKSTDVLAVSFSSHDYLGHYFGPNSPALEEMTVVDDQVLSRLLNAVNKRVPGGLANVDIVLTGDHGVAPIPDFLKPNRVDAGYLEMEKILSKIDERLTKKFGKLKSGTSWFTYFADLNFYLNREAIAAADIDREKVELEAKNAFLANEGVAHVFTASDYRARRLPPGMFERAILKTYYPSRSGDLVLIPKPFWFEHDDTADHQTTYPYDRMVPLLLTGPHFKAGVYSNPAKVVDIAPTLSFILGTLPPAGSEGRVLSESLK